MSADTKTSQQNSSLEYMEMELTASLIDRQLQYGGEAVFFRIGVSDKWILSSALQKLIRRGERSRAVSVALQLHKVDPGYLARRLPIIAVEDVGLGDLAVCREVMALCSSSRWWGREAWRTIACAVDGMASAIKSRAICDALCWAEVHPETATLLQPLLSSDRAYLVKVAVDGQRSRLERSNALRVLGGITRRVGACYESLSKCDSTGLGMVGITLKLPPLALSLLAQHRKSGNLAAMIPIAIEAAADGAVVGGEDFPHSLETVEGIPLCSIDMCGEVGRNALRDYFAGSKALKKFTAQHVRGASPVRLLNMALFHAEASLLDRYLVSPGLDEIREETEKEEMRHLGMSDPSARTELRDILVSEAHVLAETRVKHIRQHLQRRDEARSPGVADG